MKLNLALDIQISDDTATVRQVEKIMLDGKIIWQIENPPKILSFDGDESGVGEVTLIYEIEENDTQITKIEYDVDKSGDWEDVGHTNLADNIIIGSLASGNNYTFRLQATNAVGETISEELHVFVSGDFIAWSEDFEGIQHIVDDFWRDPNNNDAIAGGNVTVREKDDTPGKLVQISHIAWNQGNGCFPGTRRLTHPFSYFHLPIARAYELSVDWYFETIWDWNTIGRDLEEMKARLVANGRWDGQNKIEYTEQEAEDYIDTIVGDQETMGPGSPYYETGFPYQTGKMHGLISSHDGTAPTGGNLPDEDEWAVRCTWVKDIHSHPDQDENDVYTDGADPNVPPKLALYIADQDSTEEVTSKRYILDAFDDMALNTWYTIKLFVQINDFGKNNGIAKLTVIDRATETELGSVYVDNLKLHNVQDNSGFVHRIDFDTFFGGGTIRYQPQIDPAWEEDDLVVTNNGVYARNDNFVATRFGALESPVIESEDYSTGDLVLTVTHSIPFAQIEDINYLIVPGGASYEVEDWLPIDGDVLVSYEIIDGKAVVTIDSALISTNDQVYLRVERDGRKGARSDAWPVEFPTVPDLPVIVDIETGDAQLDVTFSPPDDGNSEITSYEYRVDGGDPVEIVEFTTNSFGFIEFVITVVNGSPLVNDQSYQVEVRAINAIGASGWSVPQSAAPKEPFTIPLSETDLIRYYDPLLLENMSSPSNVSNLPDGTGHAAMVIGAGDVPTYLEDIINGQPVLRFGNGIFLEDDGTALDELSDEFTAYVVSSSNNIEQFGSIFATSPWETNNLLNIHLPYFFNNEFLVAFEFGNRSSNGRILEPYPVASDEFHIWEFRAKPGYMDILVDGDLVYSKESSSSVSLANHILRLGWSADGTFVGDLGVLAIYKRFIDTVTQERYDNLDYLSSRFGIPCTLPVVVPPTVDSFSLSQVGKTSLTFNYTVDSKGAAIEAIEYELDDSGSWVDIGSVNEEGQFTVSGLTENQQYSVKIRVITGLGSDESSAVLGTPEEVAPTIQTFQFESRTINSITYNYQINENGSPVTAVEYQVDGGSWVSLGTILSGNFTVTELDANTEYSTKIRATNAGGTTESGAVIVSTNEQSDPLPPPTARSIPAFAYWDGQNNNLGNIIKAQGTSNALNLLDDYPDRKVLIDGFVMRSKANTIDDILEDENHPDYDPDATRDDVEDLVTNQYMIDVWTDVINSKKSSVHQIGSDRTYYILIQDEPLTSHHDFTEDEVEILADTFRDVLNTDGHQFYMGTTITRGHAHGWQDYGYPQNLDYVYLNYYPWTSFQFGQSGLNSRLNTAIGNMKSGLDMSRTLLGITAQGFYGDNNNTSWIQPPDDSPLWYAEYIDNDPDIDGMSIWLWNYGGKNNITSVNNIPSLAAGFEQAFNQYFT